MEHNVTLNTALQTDLKVSPRFFDTVGITLEQNWQLKKKFASGISNALIDKMHKTVMDAGSDGAKITGAGGGGFLVVFCNPWRQDEVRIAIEKQFAGTELNMKEMPFEIDRYGSRILMDMEVATW
jgi:D-glycero-alpha-D-manno-heptose-7-phosphate kinase